MRENEITQLIRSRRSIFPPSYNDKDIPESILFEILENANWAPNHRHTEPWRFKIFKGKALEKLSDFQADFYEKNTAPENFKAKKLEKTRKNPLRSNCVIAICMQRSLEIEIPEWEEIAAIACAVQNMWLTCTAYKIGCYWSTPKSIEHCDELLQLKEGERCMGFFYMGYHDLTEVGAKRGAVEDKIQWME